MIRLATRAGAARTLVLVTALALLAACDGDEADLTTSPPTVADSAQQILFGAGATVVADGVLRGELMADTVYVLDEGARYELRPLRLELRPAEDSVLTVVTASEGTRWIAPDRIEARGNVVVEVAATGRRLETSRLVYDVARNELASDSAFVLVEPGRTARGVGFVADPRLANVRCVADCTGGLAPAARAP